MLRNEPKLKQGVFMNKKRFILFLVLAVVIAGSAFADFDPMSFPPPISAGSVW
jgi:hypothetical protein